MGKGPHRTESVGWTRRQVLGHCRERPSSASWDRQLVSRGGQRWLDQGFRSAGIRLDHESFHWRRCHSAVNRISHRPRINDEAIRVSGRPCGN
jgi:hypothetical protein